MVPSSICPPNGYRPVLEEAAEGIYELVNAYEGTYRYFGREWHKVEDRVCAQARFIRRILRAPPHFLPPAAG
jgi:hypothetical protein